MATIANLMVKLSADIQNYEKNMTKAQKMADKVANSMIKAGKTLTLGLTAPIAALGVASFKMASDLHENMQKTEEVFKYNADAVKDWSKTTLTAIGLAQSTALDMASLYGDMATSMGLTTSAAADMSMEMVNLAGDMASFKNIGIEEVNTALTAVFTGEAIALKKLGIVMTEANLAAYAMEKGIQKNIDKMTQAEKVQLRYQYVLDMTKNAHGDFARTQGGAANQMRIFTETLKELGASFGAVFLPAITSVIKTINGWLQRIQELDEGQKKTIVTIALIVASIGPLLTIVGKAIKLYQTLKTVVLAAKAAYTALTTSQLALNAAMAANVIGVVIAAVAALVLTIQTLSNEYETLKDKAETAAMDAVAANKAAAEEEKKILAEALAIKQQNIENRKAMEAEYHEKAIENINFTYDYELKRAQKNNERMREQLQERMAARDEEYNAAIEKIRAEYGVFDLSEKSKTQVAQDEAAKRIAALDAQINAEKERYNKVIADIRAEYGVFEQVQKTKVQVLQDSYTEQSGFISDISRMAKEAMTAEGREFEKVQKNMLSVARNSHNERIQMIVAEYMQQMKWSDSFYGKNIDQYQGQIDAINQRTAAEEKAIKEAQDAEKIANLQSAVSAAETAEEKARAEKSLQDEIARQERERLLEARQTQINYLNEQIKSQIDAQRRYNEAALEDANGRLNAEQEQIKKRTDYEISQTQRARLEREAAEIELHESNLERIEAQKKASDARLDAELRNIQRMREHYEKVEKFRYELSMLLMDYEAERLENWLTDEYIPYADAKLKKDLENEDLRHKTVMSNFDKELKKLEEWHEKQLKDIQWSLEIANKESLIEALKNQQSSVSGRKASELSNLIATEQERLKNMRGYATGTVSAAPGLHWVGERGPELVNFRGGERVIPTQQAAGGDTVYNIQPGAIQISAKDVREFNDVVEFFGSFRQTVRQGYSMANQIRAPGSTANVVRPPDYQNDGAYPWSNTNNVKANDNAFASAAVSTDIGTTPGSTHYLKTSDYGFSIPAGAKITGVTLRAHVKMSAPSPSYSDLKIVSSSAQLLKNGAPCGASDFAYVDWTQTKSVMTFSWWGSNIPVTLADINSSGFGAYFWADANGLSYPSSFTAYVDYIEITVEYNTYSITPPSAPTNLIRSDFDALHPAQFAWKFNDADLGDAQSAYQLQIFDSLSEIAYDSGRTSRSVTSMDLPAGTLTNGNDYQWRVKTWDRAYQESPYSALASFKTRDQPPTAPTNLSRPNFQATQAASFTWQFNDPTPTDKQTAYQLLIYDTSDNSLDYDSGKVSSGISALILPANTLVNGKQYQWKVRTWDTSNQVSPYSSVAAFHTSAAPSVAITAPALDVIVTTPNITVAWAFSDPDGDAQGHYQAELLIGSQPVEDTGKTASASKSHTFGATLENETTYTVSENLGRQRHTEHRGNTGILCVVWWPPKPTLAISTENDRGSITVAVTNPTPGSGESTLSYNEIYRKTADEAAYTRIAVIGEANPSYTDYTPGSGMVYEYYVRAFGTNKGYTDSDSVSGSVALNRPQLAMTSDYGTFRILESQARSQRPWQEKSLMHFAGRRGPVTEYGEHESETLSLTETVEIGAELEILKRMLLSRQILLYRDERGRRLFVTASIDNITDVMPGSTVVTFKLDVTSYPEEAFL